MIEAEYGSSEPIRWACANSGNMYDSEGKIVLCKCGKPAGQAAIGKEAFIAWCSDCSPNKQQPAKFIYKPQEINL